MTEIDIALDQIFEHEGFEEEPYIDPVALRNNPSLKGTPYPENDTQCLWTIGHGQRCDQVGFPEGCSQMEAMGWLGDKVGKVQSAIFRRYSSILDHLSDERKAVLINMGYQMGVAGLFNFKKMWAALKVRDYDQAASEMLDSLWAKQTPNRAKELSDIMKGSSS